MTVLGSHWAYSVSVPEAGNVYDVPGITGTSAISSGVPTRKGIPLPSRRRIRHRHITERITTLIIRSPRTTIRVISQRDRIGIPLGIQRVRTRSRQRVRRISRVINTRPISSGVPTRKGIPLPSRCRIRHRHITERITTLIIRSPRTTIRVIGQRDRIGIPLGIQRVRTRSRQRVRRSRHNWYRCHQQPCSTP